MFSLHNAPNYILSTFIIPCVVDSFPDTILLSIVILIVLLYPY
jgi:hypothetical protein